jgi:cell division protein FtsW
MRVFSRSDRSPLARWWWTVDRHTLLAVFLLMGIGTLLIAAGSPAVAERIGLDSAYFIRRHVMILAPAAVLMLGVSLLSPRHARLLALGGFALFFLLLVSTLFVGAEIKGARRWINIGGFSLQPSEFIKPTFAVVTAWLLTRSHRDPSRAPSWELQNTAFGQPRASRPFGLSDRRIGAALLVSVLALLMQQPDFGMSMLVLTAWLGQIFLAGMPIFWVAAGAALLAASMAGAYLYIPHVTSRIDRFLTSDISDNYQVAKSLEAFRTGGLFGVGPGEGSVKLYVPDSHADFIFPVAGEELGTLICLGIVFVFWFILARGMIRLQRDPDPFALLAGAGLLLQFALQSLINMGSALYLIPTKGMTLPFMSYGGSSLLAQGLAFGLLLSFTRARMGTADPCGTATPSRYRAGGLTGAGWLRCKPMKVRRRRF